MKNLLKYEFYKGSHNSFTYVVFVVCCGIALLFTSKDYLVDPIIPRTPQNLTGVFINEVADAGLAVIIIVGCYVVFSFGNELKHRYINFEIMCGNSRKKIFWSHYFCTFLYSGSVIAVSLLIGVFKYGVFNWLQQIWEDRFFFLRVIILIYLISFSMISLCMIFATILKDSAKSTILTFIVLFITCYIMAAVAASCTTGQMASAYENTPTILILYPAYLWRWALNPDLSRMQIVLVIAITMVWCFISFITSSHLFCKTELK